MCQPLPRGVHAADLGALATKPQQAAALETASAATQADTGRHAQLRCCLSVCLTVCVSVHPCLSMSVSVHLPGCALTLSTLPLSL